MTECIKNTLKNLGNCLTGTAFSCVKKTTCCLGKTTGNALWALITLNKTTGFGTALIGASSMAIAYNKENTIGSTITLAAGTTGLGIGIAQKIIEKCSSCCGAK